MLKRIVLSVLLAAILWFLMFFPGLGLTLNFWVLMTASSLLLTSLAIVLGGWPRFRLSLSELALGIAIAVVLWLVFWVGDKSSQWLFDFARPQVDLIYGIKSGTQPTLIGLLLLFIIGPGEEIFWRGYVQRSLVGLFEGRFRRLPKPDVQRKSRDAAFLIATAAYTLIHVSSLNFMLVMAALVCGIAWGGLYRFFPNHFTAIVVSHALWDAAAFVWFPF